MESQDYPPQDQQEEPQPEVQEEAPQEEPQPEPQTQESEPSEQDAEPVENQGATERSPSLHDQRQAELARQREEHNQRTGGQ